MWRDREGTSECVNLSFTVTDTLTSKSNPSLLATLTRIIYAELTFPGNINYCLLDPQALTQHFPLGVEVLWESVSMNFARYIGSAVMYDLELIP